MANTNISKVLNISIIFLSTVLLGVIITIPIQHWAATRALAKPKDLSSKSSAAYQATMVKNTCVTQSDINLCYAKELSKLTKKNDISFTEEILWSLQDQDPQARNCHTIAHAMADAEVVKHPNDWQAILTHVDPNACSSGFFHGVLEAHTGYDSEFVISTPVIESICSNKDSLFPGGACAHIFGHLSLVQFEGQAVPALNVCQRLGSDDFKTQCYDGVFMEHDTKMILRDHVLATDDSPTSTSNTVFQEESTSNLEAFCKTFTDEQSISCWGQMGYRYAGTGKDPQTIFKNCSKAPTKNSLAACYNNAAISLGLQKNLTIPPASICQPLQQIGQDYMQSCTTKMINGILQSSSKYLDEALQTCSDQALNPDAQRACWNTTAHVVNYYIKEPQKSMACKQLPPEFQQSCMQDPQS